jgi:arylsulfatase
MNPRTHPLFPPLPLIESKSGDSVSPPDTFRVGPEISKLTTWYTERAVKFIEENRDRPFFLYLPHSMPHIPLGVSEKFKGKSDIGIYGDVMMEIDWSVGQILKTLKKVGVDDKTLVIFTSDNGPMLAWGNHGGSPGPLLRGGMGSTFEGGVRVPCIMRWPGKIPPGTVCTEIATLMDLLPTFAKLINSELPENKIDGMDIWSLMEGKPGAESPHSAFFYYRGRELRAVRSGEWKLHVPHEYRYVKKAGSGGEMGIYGYSKIDTSLFNLNVMGERHDVSKHHPEIVESLIKLIEEMRRELGDTNTDIRGTGRRPPGKIKP